MFGRRTTTNRRGKTKTKTKKSGEDEDEEKRRGRKGWREEECEPVAPSGEERVEAERARGKERMEKEDRGERYKAEGTRRLGLGVDFTKAG